MLSFPVRKSRKSKMPKSAYTPKVRIVYSSSWTFRKLKVAVVAEEKGIIAAKTTLQSSWFPGTQEYK